MLRYWFLARSECSHAAIFSSSRVSAVIVFPIVWAGYDLAQRTRLVSYREMDLQSGRREIDELEEFAALHYKPDGLAERILNWWVTLLAISRAQ